MNKSRRKRKWLLLLLLLLLGGAVGWSAWPDRRLAKAQQMQQELLDPASRNLSSEERREKWRALREATKQLSAAQRQKLRAESRKRRQAEMARYFQMSAEEKARYLDEQIARMEQRRQARAAGQGGAGRGSGQGRGQTNNGAQPGQTTDDPNATGNPRTASSRDERRQDRLDSTTPAERAQMTQFFLDLNQRRQQLGLPTGGRGFGPPR